MIRSIQGWCGQQHRQLSKPSQHSALPMAFWHTKRAYQLVCSGKWRSILCVQVSVLLCMSIITFIFNSEFMWSDLRLIIQKVDTTKPNRKAQCRAPYEYCCQNGTTIHLTMQGQHIAKKQRILLLANGSSTSKDIKVGLWYQDHNNALRELVPASDSHPPEIMTKKFTFGDVVYDRGMKYYDVSALAITAIPSHFGLAVTTPFIVKFTLGNQTKTACVLVFSHKKVLTSYMAGLGQQTGVACPDPTPHKKRRTDST